MTTKFQICMLTARAAMMEGKATKQEQQNFTQTGTDKRESKSKPNQTKPDGVAMENKDSGDDGRGSNGGEGQGRKQERTAAMDKA